MNAYRALLCLITLVAGCSRDQSASRKVDGPSRAAYVGRVAPQGNLRPVMVHLQQVMEEARRRGEGRLPMNRPARVIHRIATKELATRQPLAFEDWKRKLVAAAEKLSKSGTKQDYNALVDTCLGCHGIYAKQSVAQTRTLRLP